MTVRIANGEEYILKRLEREKRNGTIQKLANGDYKFTAEVYDASEMIPWIKTFTGRIVEIKCSNECVEKQIKEDFQVIRQYCYEIVKEGAKKVLLQKEKKKRRNKHKYKEMF